MPMKNVKKAYLIDRLINEYWFETEKEALPFLMAGRVSVDNERVTSGKAMIAVDGVIRIKEYYKKKYVNKGGLKLEYALSEFGIDVNGMAALDCGASAGGFTDCLIQRGAKIVYAVDAGFGQLAGKLLINKDVINMERTNLSDASLKMLSPKPDIITLDLSYLSLKKGVAACEAIINPRGGVIVALVKPIYEVDSAEIRRTGDINRHDILLGVLTDLCDYFQNYGFCVTGLTNSPIRGNGGALEFFICLRLGGSRFCNPAPTPTFTSEVNYEHIKIVVDKAFMIPEFIKRSANIDTHT